ncbi:hypothetical protein OAF44_04350 [Akkermansiaceae bacterium]|nr:hypothetical protein [Akkermansiaceae bacterium]
MTVEPSRDRETGVTRGVLLDHFSRSIHVAIAGVDRSFREIIKDSIEFFLTLAR